MAFDYKSYLIGWRWRAKRRAMMLKAIVRRWPREILTRAFVDMLIDEDHLRNVPCEDCSDVFPEQFINVHHLHYRTLGEERDEDLAVLCVACHAKRHNLPSPIWWPDAKRVNFECRNPPEIRSIGTLALEALENIIGYVPPELEHMPCD